MSNPVGVPLAGPDFKSHYNTSSSSTYSTMAAMGHYDPQQHQYYQGGYHNDEQYGNGQYGNNMPLATEPLYGFPADYMTARVMPTFNADAIPPAAQLANASPQYNQQSYGMNPSSGLGLEFHPTGPNFQLPTVDPSVRPGGSSFHPSGSSFQPGGSSFQPGGSSFHPGCLPLHPGVPSFPGDDPSFEGLPQGNGMQPTLQYHDQYLPPNQPNQPMMNQYPHDYPGAITQPGMDSVPPYGQPQVPPVGYYDYEAEASGPANQRFVRQRRDQNGNTDTPMKQRRRTSPGQLAILITHFMENPKPDTAMRNRIAYETGMTPRETQVWFQNRRSKTKLAKEAEERARNGLPKLDRRSKSQSSGSADTSASSSMNPTPEGMLAELPEEDEERDDVAATLPSSVSMSNVASAPVTSTFQQTPQGVEAHANAISQHLMAATTSYTTTTPSHPPPVYRRQSIANGELAKLSQIDTQRKTPTLRSASMARRGSGPYTAFASIGAPSFGPGSSSTSPLSPSQGRAPSSSLYRTVVHNNTRRASMPAPPPIMASVSTVSAALQTAISQPGTPDPLVNSNGLDSSPSQDKQSLSRLMFSTPRRTASVHNGDEENAEVIKKLLASKDVQQNKEGLDKVQSTEQATEQATAPQVLEAVVEPNVDGTGDMDMSEEVAAQLMASFTPEELEALKSMPIPNPTVDGPLPSPAFQFGGAPQPTNENVDMGDGGPQNDAFLNMQSRDRIGSMASINTFATEASDRTTDWNGDQLQWTADELAMGLDFFEPTARRASAPDALHLGINQMGIGSAPATSTPMRPSPLGPNHAVSFDFLPTNMMATQSVPAQNPLYPNFPSPSPQPNNQRGQVDMYSPSPAHAVNNNNMANINPRMNGTSSASPTFANNNGRRYSAIGVGSNNFQRVSSSTSINHFATVPENDSAPTGPSDETMSYEDTLQAIGPMDWADLEAIYGIGSSSDLVTSEAEDGNTQA